MEVEDIEPVCSHLVEHGAHFLRSSEVAGNVDHQSTVGHRGFIGNYSVGQGYRGVAEEIAQAQTYARPLTARRLNLDFAVGNSHCICFRIGAGLSLGVFDIRRVYCRLTAGEADALERRDCIVDAGFSGGEFFVARVVHFACRLMICDGRVTAQVGIFNGNGTRSAVLQHKMESIGQIRYKHHGPRCIRKCEAVVSCRPGKAG